MPQLNVQNVQAKPARLFGPGAHHHGSRGKVQIVSPSRCPSRMATPIAAVEVRIDDRPWMPRESNGQITRRVLIP